jgi:hypothetical protein
MLITQLEFWYKYLWTQKKSPDGKFCIPTLCGESESTQKKLWDCSKNAKFRFKKLTNH